jgi:hypothetical protein
VLSRTHPTSWPRCVWRYFRKPCQMIVIDQAGLYFSIDLWPLAPRPPTLPDFTTYSNILSLFHCICSKRTPKISIGHHRCFSMRIVCISLHCIFFGVTPPETHPGIDFRKFGGITFGPHRRGAGFVPSPDTSDLSPSALRASILGAPRRLAHRLGAFGPLFTHHSSMGPFKYLYNG